MLHEKLSQGKIFDVNVKITINRPFRNFSAIIEIVRELVTSKIQNKFEKNIWKTFEVTCQQIYVNAKCRTLIAIFHYM